jgi:uncharacterized membrane protein YoaK (UPF0700 family)
LNTERPREILLLMLSTAAGCVDAIAFINAGVFPANMTGNTVVLATSLLLDGSAALLSGLALVAFCCGAAAGAWMVHSPDKGWSPRVTAAVFAGAALVLAASLCIAFLGTQLVIPVILATSIAMGIQSAAVQQLGVAGVATVFMTGTLTTAVTRAIGFAIDRPAAQPGRWLPALTWLGYFTGAFIGGLHRAFGTKIPFALPSLLLLSVAIYAALRPRSLR